MSRQHLVRVGVLGQVGRFRSVDAARYPRGARVVCRTSRGLEVGEVLKAAEHPVDETAIDGSLLRRLTVQDRLLLQRIERNKEAAYQSCRALLASRGIAAVLVDVEHLLDGQSLFFYFLGEVPPEVQAITAELVEEYEAKVQFRKFTEAVTAGCGPGCGTEQAAGGCGADSVGGCASCAVAGSCTSAYSDV